MSTNSVAISSSGTAVRLQVARAAHPRATWWFAFGATATLCAAAGIMVAVLPTDLPGGQFRASEMFILLAMALGTTAGWRAVGPRQRDSWSQLFAQGVMGSITAVSVCIIAAPATSALRHSSMVFFSARAPSGWVAEYSTSLITLSFLIVLASVGGLTVGLWSEWRRLSRT